jgi:hypothetical protein
VWVPRTARLPARRDIQVEIPGERSVPNILKFPPQDVSRQHGQVRMFAFQGLHPCQLIHADRPFSLLRSLGCLCVDLAPLHDFLFSLRVSFFGQPIAEPVGLEAPFLRRRAACRGEISLTIPRATSSSAISLPVHWLIGRPVLAGASQARTAI